MYVCVHRWTQRQNFEISPKATSSQKELSKQTRQPVLMLKEESYPTTKK